VLHVAISNVSPTMSHILYIGARNGDTSAVRQHVCLGQYASRREWGNTKRREPSSMTFTRVFFPSISCIFIWNDVDEPLSHISKSPKIDLGDGGGGGWVRSPYEFHSAFDKVEFHYVPEYVILSMSHEF
jgi:hypothetical protein